MYKQIKTTTMILQNTLKTLLFAILALALASCEKEEAVLQDSTTHDAKPRPQEPYITPTKVEDVPAEFLGQ